MVSVDYEESKKIFQTLVDFSWNKYHKQHDHFDSLDQKATTFAGFIGIILTLVTAFSNKILSIPFLINDFLQLEVIFLKIILLVIICLLALAFYYSIVSLRISRVLDPSTISELMNYYQKLKSIDNIHRRHKQLLFGITKTLSNSEVSIKNCNVKKSASIKRVTILLIVALILGIIEISLFFINIEFNN